MSHPKTKRSPSLLRRAARKIFSSPKADKPKPTTITKPSVPKPSVPKPSVPKPSVPKPSVPKKIATKPKNLALTVAHLEKEIQNSETDRDRYDATARLVALSPSVSAQDATNTFNVLVKTELWSLFSLYVRRLPQKVQILPHVRMMDAVCLHRSGNFVRALPIFHNALLATNNHTISGASYTILTAHIDGDALLQETLHNLHNTQIDRSALIFAFLFAYQAKNNSALEQLLESPFVIDLREQDSLLTFQSARAARAVGRIDEAAELIFRAHKLNPEEGMISATAVDIARGCASDEWVDPAIRIGEKIRHEIQNVGMVRQIVTSLAKLYSRSEDQKTAIFRLRDLANTDLPFDSVHLAIARSQVLLGESAAADQTLLRYLEKDPNNNIVTYNRAGILVAQDKVIEAFELIDSMPTKGSAPETTEAIIGHAYAWSDQCHLAKPWLTKALRKNSKLGSAWADLSLCTELENEYTLALALAEKACAEFVVHGALPSMIGFEFMHLARLRRRMMFLADMTGNEIYARALQREAMMKAPLELPYPIEEWTGQSFKNKSIMVLGELGIGDEIRYTSVLHAICSETSNVTLSCDPRLHSLFKRSFPNVNIMPVQREFPGIRNRRSDPRALGTTEAMRKIMSDDLIRHGETADLWMRGRHFFESQCLDRSRPVQSTSKAVLKVNSKLARDFTKELKAHAKGRKVIGLSWRGGRRTYNREPHYFQLEQWLPLLNDSNLCFVNLQYAVRDDEIAWLRNILGERYIEFPELDLFDDMEGVAALCTKLDLVVAICTSVLELACAVNTHCLYLMRSPQVTHAIRFSGISDKYGSYQDAVWSSCRIIPRTNMTDISLVELGQRYISNYFSNHE